MPPVSVLQSVSELAEWQMAEWQRAEWQMRAEWQNCHTEVQLVSPTSYPQSRNISSYPEFTQTWTAPSYARCAALKASLYLKQLLPLAQLGLHTCVIFSYLTEVLLASFWPDAFYIQFLFGTVFSFTWSLFWGFTQSRKVLWVQPIGPFFKGKAGSDRFSRNVAKERRSQFAAE